MGKCGKNGPVVMGTKSPYGETGPTVGGTKTSNGTTGEEQSGTTGELEANCQGNQYTRWDKIFPWDESGQEAAVQAQTCHLSRWCQCLGNGVQPRGTEDDLCGGEAGQEGQYGHPVYGTGQGGSLTYGKTLSVL